MNVMPNPQEMELLRIISIPVVDPYCLYDKEVGRNFIYPQAWADNFRFFPAQVAALKVFQKYEGLFAPIGVGDGKTLITLAAAKIAFEQQNVTKALLMIPPTVYRQLFDQDLPMYRSYVKLTYRVIGLAGSKKKREGYVKSGMPGLYVLPYSMLSAASCKNILHDLAPELIILDEAHMVINKSARTSRLFSYLRNHKSKMIALSGTMTKKSIRDYVGVMRKCLKPQFMPLPNIEGLLDKWAVILDAESPQQADEPVSAEHVNAIRPLIQWADRTFDFRDEAGKPRPLPLDNPTLAGRIALRARISTTPGVVVSNSSLPECSLYYHTVLVPQYSNEMAQRMKKLYDEWVAPNGDEIEHALLLYNWAYQLTSGFFYNHYWPTPEQLAAKLKISEQEAESRIAASKIHHELKQDYHKILRAFLNSGHIRGIDSPLLVAQEIRLGNDRIPSDVVAGYQAMKDAETEEVFTRWKDVVFFDDNKVDILIDLLNTISDTTIVWVHHKELQRYVYDKLIAAGVDAIFCPAGDNKSIAKKWEGKKVAVASITAHSTGKNLQHYGTQVFFQWPRSATRAEQSVGRSHRSGQTRDEVNIYRIEQPLMDFEAQVLCGCLLDSVYVHTTTTPLKILLGTHIGKYKVFSPSILRARGIVQRNITDDVVQRTRKIFES